MTDDPNQQIINSIVSLSVNCVTALIVLCIKFFDKKTLNKFLKDIDQKNSEVIEKLSNVNVSARSEIYNEPITPSVQDEQQNIKSTIIPIDTHRNLIIKPK